MRSSRARQAFGMFAWTVRTMNAMSSAEITIEHEAGDHLHVVSLRGRVDRWFQVGPGRMMRRSRRVGQAGRAR